MAVASSISHDSSEKGNGDDEFVHVECNSRDVSVSLRKIRIEL